MVIVSWLLWYLSIAAVLTCGALAWERAARWSGTSARWTWLMALAGSVTLPWLLRLLPERGWTEAVPTALPLVRLDPVVAGGWSSGPGLLDVAEGMWLGASLLMVGYIGWLMLRLLRMRRLWREESVDGGGAVLVSGGVGPAVVGVRRSRVVLPEWALELDAEQRDLLLRHERAHADAGDPRALLGGLLLVAVMPWNPLVWVQLVRLRNAIELDCDARVLGAGVDPARYGALLLEVGRRQSGHALVMATFAEPRMLLARRIARIAQWPPERRHLRASGYAAAAAVIFGGVLSCADPARIADATRQPGDVIGLPTPPRDAPAVADSTKPHFTPMTVAPKLVNRTETELALARSYPPLLRDAGIGGRPAVLLFVDDGGSVHRARISRSSGYAALDTAALAVARQMRFEPALNRERKVAVWIELPIIFTATAAASSQSEVQGEPEPTPARDVPPRPTASPLERDGVRSPELLNQEETVRKLVSAYPPLLRDAGIGASPTVHFYIDERGAVQRIESGKQSGYPALDEAALEVARVMRFSPATKDGRAVAMWVEIPIVFTAR